MQKEFDSQKSTVAKSLNVVKELLIEKSTIERKEARCRWSYKTSSFPCRCCCTKLS